MKFPEFLNNQHMKVVSLSPLRTSRLYRQKIFMVFFSVRVGAGSVVGIAIAYGLEGPGIESRWGEIFRTSPDRPGGPPSLLYNGYRVFPGGKVLPGR